MLQTYIESHSSSLTAQAGQEQQNKRDEPRARDEDDHVGRRREGHGPGLRNCEQHREKAQSVQGFNAHLSFLMWRTRASEMKETKSEKCKTV